VPVSSYVLTYTGKVCVEFFTREFKKRMHPHYRNLSPRELEVLGMIALGLKNDAIATKLGVVRRTVEQHITSILGKLGVADRTSAVLKALKEGDINLQ